MLRELYKSSIGNNRSGKRPVLSPIILSMLLSIYASISILEGTATVLSSAMAIFFNWASAHVELLLLLQAAVFGTSQGK